MPGRSVVAPAIDRTPYVPAIARAARLLAAGSVIAYPTEGVYGLGCLPTKLAAIERILKIKQRSWRKGLALIAASFEQLEPWVRLPRDGLREEILASWPGAVTWVLPAHVGVPALLTGGRRTLAVRVTAHRQTRLLCLRTGSALISTSANLSGRPPLRSALAVRRRLGRDVDLTLAGPLGELHGPTPIRDGLTGSLLRAGRPR